ncbi:hypothetical protein BTN49_3248 (plasmid) [Candidatus Enterovibrio escicola]|uniref:Uncharacterized protein n=1 Tax=Candidatus Enterovibrio escicola TaxID=1927127 RepID=A0A2A5SZ53_9GAMM|nr:hypothetical protein BTN49_3248 [Candidatus Enterovibrio escacola]
MKRVKKAFYLFEIFFFGQLRRIQSSLLLVTLATGVGLSSRASR